VSITYSLDAAATPQPAAAPPPPAPTGPPPTIVANRRRLDDRFPVLGFNIRTQGRPYFEVLLATDRTLFDPANAAKRTPSNFYAGRQDGGLARAGVDDTAYIVPAAVLRRFADAKPRPDEIFFTVAAYDTPDGAPILALPPQALATSAPSVLLGRDFRAQTMAVVLGVPAEKLRPVGQLDVPALAEPEPELDDDGLPAGAAQAWSSDEDEAEADAQAAAAWMEDPQAMALDAEDEDDAYAAEDEEPEIDYGASVDDVDVDVDEMAYDDGYDDDYGALEDEPPAAAAADDGEEPEVEGQEGDWAYEDGYEEAGWAGAEESAFPEGAAEPATLSGEEDYDDDLGAEPYEDDEPAAEPAAEPYESAYEEDVYDEPYAASSNGSAAVAAPAPAVAPAAPAPAAPLGIPGTIALLAKLGRLFVAPEGYTAASLDGQGMRIGFVGFRGRLIPRLLQLMRKRDAAAYRATLGTDAETLPATEDSVTRLRAAGGYTLFQAAQNELAATAFVRPMLSLASGFGLDSERALAMAVDRALELGPREARAWIARAVSPVQADAQRQQALGALGMQGVPEFQRAAGVKRDGDFGPRTQAAMVAALRRLGPASPIPIPAREQMMDAIVARADAEAAPWRQRPRTIRTSQEFGDAPMVLTPPTAPGR
jgi:hypothetical protein